MRPPRRSLQLRCSMPDNNATLWDGGEVTTGSDAEDADGGAAQHRRRRRRRRGSGSTPSPELTVEEARDELQRLEQRLEVLQPAATGSTHAWKVNRLAGKLKRVQASAAPPPWYNCPKIEAHSGSDAGKAPKEGRRQRKTREKRQSAKRNQLASLSLERVDLASLQTEWLKGLDIEAMSSISPKDSAIGAWIAQHGRDQEAVGGDGNSPPRALTAGGAGESAVVPSPVVRARALHDWGVAAGAAVDDLHFAAGDEFRVVGDAPGQGWLTGSVHDDATGETKVGIFPANYVEIVTPLLHEQSKESKSKGSRSGGGRRTAKLAEPRSRGSPRRSDRGRLSSGGGSSVDVSGHVSISELLGQQYEEAGWKGACTRVLLHKPDGGWNEKGWKRNAAVEGTVAGTAGAGATGSVPLKEGAFGLHALGPNAGLGAVFTIADDHEDAGAGYDDEQSGQTDPRTHAVCGIVAVHPRSVAFTNGVAPEQVVVAINGSLCAGAAEGGAVMSRHAAVLAMLDDAVHGSHETVELHLATPQRWRNIVLPKLRAEFGTSKRPAWPDESDDGLEEELGSSSRPRKYEALFYQVGGRGGGVRVHPLYWTLGPDDMCVTVEYTAMNAQGAFVDGHSTGAEAQSTSDHYLAAVQLREAMGESFGPATPSGSPDLPVSLLPAVGINKGRRKDQAVFEVQLAKRWDTGLEIYSIAPLVKPALHDVIMAASTASAAADFSGSNEMDADPLSEVSIVRASNELEPTEFSEQQPVSEAAVTPLPDGDAEAAAPAKEKKKRFSLPDDTESAIVTKIGETLGFWVAGDDITYDTFGE